MGLGGGAFSARFNILNFSLISDFIFFSFYNYSF
jgi:hypothetical protein